MHECVQVWFAAVSLQALHSKQGSLELKAHLSGNVYWLSVKDRDLEEDIPPKYPLEQNLEHSKPRDSQVGIITNKSPKFFTPFNLSTARWFVLHSPA